MVTGCGPLPVLQTLRDKEPFSRRGGFRKERVIVPGPGVGTALIEVFWFRRAGFSHSSTASTVFGCSFRPGKVLAKRRNHSCSQVVGDDTRIENPRVVPFGQSERSGACRSSDGQKC